MKWPPNTYYGSLREELASAQPVIDAVWAFFADTPGDLERRNLKNALAAHLERYPHAQ